MEKQIEKVKCLYCDKTLKNTPRSIGAHVGYWHKDIAKEIYAKPVVEFTIKCKICDELVANSNNVLARHVRKEHKIEWPAYQVLTEYNNVWPVCKCGCNTKLKWAKGGFPGYLRGHSNKGKNNGMYGKRGADSPNFGKVRTSKQKESYSKAAQKRWDEDYDERVEVLRTDEYREKMSKANKLSYNSSSRASRVSKGMLKYWNNNPEMRKVYSERAIQLLEDGIIGPQAPFKTEWKFNPFTQQNEYMHSGWESRFLDECVSRGEPVTKKHDIRIPYKDPNGVERTYVPDFLSLSASMLYEVKGQENDNDPLKCQAAIDWSFQNDKKFCVIRF